MMLFLKLPVALLVSKYMISRLFTPQRKTTHARTNHRRHRGRRKKIDAKAYPTNSNKQ